MSELDWDRYWQRAQDAHQAGPYERAAEFYRKRIIAPAAAAICARYFPNEPSRQYLHAGCGSGGSDQRLRMDRAVVHALDLSATALLLNRRRPIAGERRFVQADLFRLPYRSASIDGLFNFGVMEHFELPDIERLLAEFRRVLKPGARAVLFWPPNFGLSVMAVTCLLWIINRFRTEPMAFYPDEVSRVRSFGWVRRLMEANAFRVIKTHFGPRDLFTFVVVVATPEPVAVAPDAAPDARELTHAAV